MSLFARVFVMVRRGIEAKEQRESDDGEMKKIQYMTSTITTTKITLIKPKMKATRKSSELNILD